MIPRGGDGDGFGPEQGLGDGQVARVGDLQVVLAARHHVHPEVRQIAQYDPAVVGGGQVAEARVGVGELVGAADHR